MVLNCACFVGEGILPTHTINVAYLTKQQQVHLLTSLAIRRFGPSIELINFPTPRRYALWHATDACYLCLSLSFTLDIFLNKYCVLRWNLIISLYLSKYKLWYPIKSCFKTKKVNNRSNWLEKYLVDFPYLAWQKPHPPPLSYYEFKKIRGGCFYVRLG